jgi:4-hydroxy-3-polyprenylbenzoate decarboxylase
MAIIPKMAARRRLIVGISGASGVVYGMRLLELLREAEVETHLVMTRSAEITLAHETGCKAADVKALADCSYANEDIAAAIASGSFPTSGMIVAPCSIRSLSEIATGGHAGLLSRAADVCLKERRRVVLMVRETPLHAGHLQSMLRVTEIGAIVYPPVPAMYAQPSSVEELIDQTLGRILDLFDIDAGTVRRWGEDCGKTGPRSSRAENED